MEEDIEWSGTGSIYPYTIVNVSITSVELRWFINKYPYLPFKHNRDFHDFNSNPDENIKVFYYPDIHSFRIVFVVIVFAYHFRNSIEIIIRYFENPNRINLIPTTYAYIDRERQYLKELHP